MNTLSMVAWQVRRIQDYIDRNITEPIKVTELCALVNRTPSHFSRTFKRTFGLSPHAYVLRRRIQLASQLLAQSEMPLSEIALHCGFGDQSHLSNRFREHSGMTPAAWRRTYRSSGELEALLTRHASNCLPIRKAAPQSARGAQTPPGETQWLDQHSCT